MFGLRAFVFCALVSTSYGARILAVFPTPSVSHQVVFRPFTQELSRRGHQVVVITPYPAFPKGQVPENLTEIDVHDISYGVWRETMAQIRNGKQDDLMYNFDVFTDGFNKIFKAQSAVPEVRDIIENQKDKFDLLLVETCARQSLAFSHIIKVPVISVSSFGGVYGSVVAMGAPNHPLIYPEPFETRIYDLTLGEKINLYINSYKIRSKYEMTEEKETANVRNIFGTDFPSLSELNKNIAMLFLNIHPVWEGNRPVPPGVVHIAGIYQKPQKELPQDWKTYLDSSKHGVIYLSFGSNVDTSILPLDKIQAIINVFSKLPFDILWKWNEDELPGRTENIKISKWLPQSDLLRHPKIKLFVTHGGLQSTEETIIAGVPVVGIPMFGDQWYNTEKYVHHGIGKQVNLVDLNEETLMSAIKTVIEDKRYRDIVIRLRELMHDQPQSPLDRAVFWTEHVLRHGGGAHLRSPAANLDWFEYYEVKLVLVVLSIAVTAVVLLSIVLWKTVKCVLGKSGSSKVKRS